MQIHEFQAKSLLKDAFFDVMPFEVIASLEEIPFALERLGEGPYLITPQIHGQRPHRVAVERSEVRSALEQILGASYEGKIAHQVLMTRYIPWQKEESLIWTLQERPEGQPQELHTFFEKRDLTRMELVVRTTTEGRRFLGDATLHVDDKALYRQKEMMSFFDSTQMSSTELYAARFGFSYTEYEGKIGCLASGEGLGASMVKAVERFGGEASALISLQGQESKAVLEGALNMLMKRSSSLLITLYPEMMNAEVIACFLASVLSGKKIAAAVRIVGEKQDAARALLAKYKNIQLFYNQDDAIKKAIIMAGLL